MAVVINAKLVPIACAALERVKELVSLMGFLSWVQELGNERAPRLPESEVRHETRMQRALEAPLAEVRVEISQLASPAGSVAGNVRATCFDV
jgi:hypothetical protein